MVEKVNLKYDPKKNYPWRIVHAGTDICVQRGGESLAYEHRGDAMAAIAEFGLELDGVVEVAEKLYVPFIIAYESALGKGWEIIDAVDTKDALEKFKEKEPVVHEMCQSPYGTIHIASVLNEGDILERNVKECPFCHGTVHRYEHMFQCERCRAIGDLVTGIMTKVDREQWHKLEV